MVEVDGAAVIGEVVQAGMAVVEVEGAAVHSRCLRQRSDPLQHVQAPCRHRCRLHCRHRHRRPRSSLSRRHRAFLRETTRKHAVRVPKVEATALKRAHTVSLSGCSRSSSIAAGSKHGLGGGLCELQPPVRIASHDVLLDAVHGPGMSSAARHGYRQRHRARGKKELAKRLALDTMVTRTLPIR